MNHRESGRAVLIGRPRYGCASEWSAHNRSDKGRSDMKYVIHIHFYLVVQGRRAMVVLRGIGLGE